MMGRGESRSFLIFGGVAGNERGVRRPWLCYTP